MLEGHAILLALGFTLFAGLATGIGSALAFFSRRTNKSFLSLALGFSAGVMLYVSFVEIFPQARQALSLEYGDKFGYWVTVLAFFGGIVIVGIIDRLLPESENPHEMHTIEEMEEPKANHVHQRLMRLGLFTALADPTLGIAIACAIAIHNIPEGIAVSVPIFYATGNRKKAFWYSFLSGLAEPVGALIGYLILMPFFSPLLFGIIFAGVGGIMVFISLDELLPAAQEFGHHHLAIYGLIAGMVVMAFSLLLFV